MSTSNLSLITFTTTSLYIGSTSPLLFILHTFLLLDRLSFKMKVVYFRQFRLCTSACPVFFCDVVFLDLFHFNLRMLAFSCFFSTRRLQVTHLVAMIAIVVAKTTHLGFVFWSSAAVTCDAFYSPPLRVALLSAILRGVIFLLPSTSNTFICCFSMLIMSYRKHVCCLILMFRRWYGI